MLDQTQVALYTQTLLQQIEDAKKAKSGMFTISGSELLTAINGFITAVDSSIKYVETSPQTGKEKKAFVLAVLSRLFDTTITPILPIWVYPWQSKIKDIIVNQAASSLIDFIVSKYNSGNWGKIAA